MSTTTRPAPIKTGNPAINLALTGGITFIWCAIFFICIQSIQGNQLSNFGTLWASGNAANHGLNPFAAYPESWRTSQSQDLNLNPPFTLPLLQALSLFPLHPFFRTWTVFSGILLSFAGWLLFKRTLHPWQFFWLFVSAPVIATFISGQIYFLPFLFCAIAVYSYPRNEWLAAIFTGLAIGMRPSMVIWLLLLFVSGHIKLAVRSTIAIAVAYAIPLAIYGPKIYRQWLGGVAENKHWISTNSRWVEFENVAFIPMANRYGFKAAGIFAAVALAIFVFWWGYRNKPDFGSASIVGICAAILCAPVGWFEYFLFAMPFFVVRRWSPIQKVAAVLLVLPYSLVHNFSFVLYMAAIIMILGHEYGVVTPL
jgi:alpha-1,2-mannosyltransferase